jgi:hypothetical protein
MNPTETTQVNGAQPASQAVLGPGSGFARTASARNPAAADSQLGPRHSGYGLPCAKCRTYYAADLPACPVCKANERVSPTVAVIPASEIAADDEPMVDAAALEEERERFLREFKSQLSTQPMQINASENYCCSRTGNHPGGFEAAAVCQGCYDHLQERVDLLEAALHIDVKAAAQLVYDAVWADPSDPGKTYQNAAQALLNELHKRAGISAVLGPLQPRPH